MADEKLVSPPKVIVISGPNGAGKSTAAPQLLQGALEVTEFVNADVIARGLSAFEPERVAMQAGRIMLARLDDWPSSALHLPLKQHWRAVHSPTGSRN